MQPGTDGHPLRIAVIGSGPAGFYVADHFFKQKGVVAHIDMFDRLPTPFGLVRGGVAPDHQKIKNVTRVFDKIARNDRFCFYGNVEIGRHISIDDLQRFYHSVVLATGAQTDRSLGIPGEDLEGSHSATEFVAWYNGHPDFQDHTFNLEATDVVVVGVGNVAVDVARILCKTPAELETTDIADDALEALRKSRVRNVYMLGRRGPAQAAFSNPEIKELGELDDADVILDPVELVLDEASREQAESDRETAKKVEILNDLESREPRDTYRKLHIRFLVSPIEILDDGHGRVGGVRVGVNDLVTTEDGTVRPRLTEQRFDLPAQLVFRSVGYRGVRIPGLPFDERNGIIPNDAGRILYNSQPMPGLYVAGWIKRGPTGVIGTNKPDAVETVESILEDAQAGKLPTPASNPSEAALDLIQKAQPDHVSYDDWLCLDEREISLGAESGRPRVKMTRLEQMLEELRKRELQDAAPNNPRT
jgi:ferredoxin/flavodoxin---NADP+ reductase